MTDLKSVLQENADLHKQNEELCGQVRRLTDDKARLQAKVDAYEAVEVIDGMSMMRDKAGRQIPYCSVCKGGGPKDLIPLKEDRDVDKDDPDHAWECSKCHAIYPSHFSSADFQ